jgi:hypothetical protein
MFQKALESVEANIVSCYSPNGAECPCIEAEFPEHFSPGLRGLVLVYWYEMLLASLPKNSPLCYVLDHNKGRISAILKCGIELADYTAITWIEYAERAMIELLNQ